VLLHRGGGIGERRSGARAEGEGLPFISAGEAEGVRRRRHEGRVWELKARRATTDAHRTSPAGGAAGGPARARAGGHARV
jgi:hypothetical protein